MWQAGPQGAASTSAAVQSAYLLGRCLLNSAHAWTSVRSSHVQCSRIGLSSKEHGRKMALSCLTIYSDNKSFVASSDFRWRHHCGDEHCILYCACCIIISWCPGIVLHWAELLKDDYILSSSNKPPLSVLRTLELIVCPILKNIMVQKISSRSRRWGEFWWEGGGWSSCWQSHF